MKFFKTVSWLHGRSSSSTDPGPPPFGLRLRSSSAFIILAVSMAVFTDIFLYAVIVPVMPFALTVRAGVAPGAATQSWVSILLAVYGASLFLSSIPFGWLADHASSRRMPLLLSLFALGGATILLCVGTSTALFVVGRILQGAAGGAVWSVGLALLVDTVGDKEIGHAMGYVSLAMSLAVLVGPLLGGVVYERVGYYPVYYMCFGMVGVDIVLRCMLIEKKIAKRWLDAEVVCQMEREGEGVTIQEDEAKARREADVAIEGRDEIGATTTKNKDVDVEKQIRPQSQSQSNPQLPTDTTSNEPRRSRIPSMIRMLASRRLCATLFLTLAFGIVITGFDSVLALRTSALFNFNSLGAGLMFLPLVIPTFSGPLLGIVADKYGARWSCTLGALMQCPILICMRFVDHGGIRQIVLLCALLALLGLTLTMLVVPIMAEITYTIEAKQSRRPGIYGPKGAFARGYALFNMAYALGTLLGPLWAGYVYSESGWANMTLSLGLFMVLVAGVSALFCGGDVWRRRTRLG